jgi:Zn-dependent peptidase ImmA (M78 family)
MKTSDSATSESPNLPNAFRRQCEHIATRERYALGLKAFDALPAQLLAEAYQATVLTPDQLVNVDVDIIELVMQQPGWSAMLICTAPLIILHNPMHSSARQQANLMHELAHHFLKHPLALFDAATQQVCATPLHEKQASYLGSCLQIPQRGLAWASQRGWHEQQIATHFGASLEMVRWRSNVTGIALSLMA